MHLETGEWEYTQESWEWVGWQSLNYSTNTQTQAGGVQLMNNSATLSDYCDPLLFVLCY